MLTPQVTDLLLCPACGAGPLDRESFSAATYGEIENGILWCSRCRNWYPIEDGLLELLSGPIAYEKDRSRFWTAHEGRLRGMGLELPGAVSPREEDSDVRRQQEHFDWYAENELQTYTAYEATPFWTAVDAITFEDWRREAEPGKRLLDVGCAQGRSTVQWRDLDLEIVAFDISKPLVRQATDRFRRLGAKARATFFVADATRFPIATASFDYVLTYGVLHHLPDPARTCREIVRVLRPGGLFFGSENNSTVFRRLFDLLQSLWPQWHEEAGHHAVISEQQLRRWFEAMGSDLSVKTSVFLPPQLVNLLSFAAAESLLRATDRAGRLLPGLRCQGGLILARGRKNPIA